MAGLRGGLGVARARTWGAAGTGTAPGARDRPVPDGMRDDRVRGEEAWRARGQAATGDGFGSWPACHSTTMASRRDRMRATTARIIACNAATMPASAARSAAWARASAHMPPTRADRGWGGVGRSNTRVFYLTFSGAPRGIGRFFQGEEGCSFLKKRTKNFFHLRLALLGETGANGWKVFLLLFLQKKKSLACLGQGVRWRPRRRRRGCVPAG